MLQSNYVNNYIDKLLQTYLVVVLALKPQNSLALPWPRENLWLWLWPQRLLALDELLMQYRMQYTAIQDHSRSLILRPIMKEHIWTFINQKYADLL